MMIVRGEDEATSQDGEGLEGKEWRGITLVFNIRRLQENKCVLTGFYNQNAPKDRWKRYEKMQD